MLRCKPAFKRLTLLLTLLVNVLLVQAQLTANFTPDKTSGCFPSLTVHFTNTTTGASPSATYTWDFGNGNSSQLQSPGATYTAVNSYTVTLTVRDGANTSTKQATIVVHQKPTADFTVAPVKGCIPFTTSFTSTSTPGDGTITDYFWDFGDGNTSRGANGTVSHQYTLVQKYSVGLTVTNSYGCQSDPVQKTDVVEAEAAVTSAFSADKTVLCNVSDVVNFTGTGTGPGTLTYTWDFGDGTSSTSQSPSHSYNQKGIYSVKYTVSSSEGCSNSTSKASYINVANFSSAISISPALICTNNYVTFTGQATPAATQSQWFFSNNNYATYLYGNTVSSSFPTAGNYTVRLVNTFGTCKDTVEKQFTVSQAPSLTGFVIDNTALCGAPITVNFRDTSSNATAWGWDFVNYNSNYPHITATSQAASYTYTSDGTYTIFLNVTSASGCTSYATKTITISKPIVDISATVISGNGCIGSTITASARSYNATIATYQWNFGDGGTAGNDPTPNHTYNSAGYFTITLTYTTTNGCTGTATYPITIYTKPVAAFTVANTTVCGNLPETFIDQSPAPTTGHLWIFGDGSTSYAGYDNTHQYNNPGTYTVTLIESNGTCSDTLIKTNYITVLPPFPKISTVTNTCNGTRGNVTFDQITRLATGWQWDFGDGGTQTTTSQTPVTHTYTQTGKYKVVLTATNGQCSVRDSTTAYVLLKQNPVLTANKTTVCASDVLAVQINNLEVDPYPYNYNYSYSYVTNKWQYGDGTFFSGTNGYYGFNTSYSGTLMGLTPGKDSLRVILASYGPLVCPDTSNYIPLIIKGPIVGFTASPNSCYKTPVVFTDTSKSTSSVPLTNWQWTFGDGATQTASTGGGTISHLYASPGYYTVNLKVTDQDGCYASTTGTTIQTSGPKAAFYWSPASVQPNIPAYYYNTSAIYGSGTYQYQWSFSYDGFTSSSSYSVPRTYPHIGTDTVTLIVTNATTHCADTLKQVVPIKNVNAQFTYTTQYLNNNSCPPLIVYLHSTATNVNSISWNFGDGSTAGNNPSPSHTYNKPGVYTITLYAYGNNNAVDSIKNTVTVDGPYAVLSSDIVQGCAPATATLSAVANNTTSYTWDFGDGTVQQTSDTFATHTYITPGQYTPALIMQDAGGCSASFQLPYKLLIDTLHVSVNASTHLVCDSGIVQFSTGEYSISPASQVTYHWNFDTGNPKDTSDLATPGFNYTITGKYPVDVQALSAAGCIATASDTIYVKPSSRGIVSGPAEICEDLPVQYTATPTVAGDVVWHWVFAAGNTDDKQTPDPQQFKGATTPYDILLVTTYNGCKDTTHTPLMVYTKPAINLLPLSPVICLGDTVELHAHDGNIYQWSPADSLSDATVAEPFAFPALTTKYHVVVTNIHSCVNNDSVVVKVQLPFKIQVSKDTFVCVGSTVQLRASGADDYVWTTGTADLSDIHIANPIASPKAAGSYKVIGTDQYNCFIDSAIVNVDVKPLPTVSAGPDITMPVGSVIPLNATGSPDVVGYLWSPSTYLDCTNCATPTSTPRSNITYVVTARTKYGCTATDDVAITLQCVNNTVFLPSGFTPNNDHLNDMFYPMGRGIKTVKHFVIYNRAGQVLFDRADFNINDRSMGWNGKYNGNYQDPGVYVYMIELECDTGEVFVLKGTITLIR